MKTDLARTRIKGADCFHFYHLDRDNNQDLVSKVMNRQLTQNVEKFLPG